MSAAGFMRLKKLTSPNHVLVASRHNKRTIQAERGAGLTIDATRSHLNYSLAGEATPELVAARATQLMSAAGIAKVRKKAVRAIEVIFSLPLNLTIDQNAFFTDCVAWSRAQFGGHDNILSADVHLDETAPHCHVLILPLIAGRMNGSDMVGNKTNLARLQTAFYESVASKYGLNRAPPRLSPLAREELCKTVLTALRARADGAMRSDARQVIRDAIERDPTPFAHALGVSFEATQRSKPKKSFVEIMTSKGKGATRDIPIGKQTRPNPIGNDPRRKVLSLCPVGKVPPQHVSTDSIQAANEVTRIRDIELSAGAWNPETGEFMATTYRPQLQKTAAAKWVDDQLTTRSQRQTDNQMAIP